MSAFIKYPKGVRQTSYLPIFMEKNKESIGAIDMNETTNYFWVRVYDYNHERDHYEKGTMLDELYLKELAGGREEAKHAVRDKYCSGTSSKLSFAKPKKESDGIYAIVMESTKFYYDRFYATINTHCFWCLKAIEGKASEFPRERMSEGSQYSDHDNVYSGDGKTVFFCTYDCKSHFNHSQNPIGEGEWQSKEAGHDGDIFGYVYLMYNRAENIHYIGQTRFMPFFRWQEHIKDGSKGDISDLTFSVLAQIGRNKQQSDAENQIYLNNIEAWWIAKYQHEQHKVFNITKPKITIEYLKERFDDMVTKQEYMLI